MGMDIRFPIGLMFTVFGVLLTIFGVFSNPAIYRASLGININVIWGVVLMAFGIVMLVLGRKTVTPASKDEAAPKSNDLATARSRSEG